MDPRDLLNLFFIYLVQIIHYDYFCFYKTNHQRCVSFIPHIMNKFNSVEILE